jgi:hypothetical protein
MHLMNAFIAKRFHAALFSMWSDSLHASFNCHGETQLYVTKLFDVLGYKPAASES